jgi:hypothetical protein
MTTFSEFLNTNNISVSFFEYAQGDTLDEFYGVFNNSILTPIDFDKFIRAFKSRFLNRTLVQDFTVPQFINDFYACVTEFEANEQNLRLPLISAIGKISNGKYKKEETTLSNNLTTEISSVRTLENTITDTTEQKDYHAPANILGLDNSNIKGGQTGNDTSEKSETQNDDNTQSTTQTTTNSIEVYGELTAQEIELIQEYSKKFLGRCLNYFEPLFLGVF